MQFNLCNWFRTHSFGNKMTKMCLSIKNIKHELSYFIILSICLTLIESSQVFSIPKQHNSGLVAPKPLLSSKDERREKVFLGKLMDTDLPFFTYNY